MLIYADNNNHCGIDRGSLEADQHSMIAALHEQGSTLMMSRIVRPWQRVWEYVWMAWGALWAQQLRVTGGWIGLLRLAFEPQSCLAPSFRSLWDTSQCGPW